MRVLSKPVERMRPDAVLRFGDIDVRVIDPGLVEFPEGLDILAFLERYGEMPLPPYIKPPADLDAVKAYQPIFARIDGSVAAPTASLHFTETVLADLQARGIEMAELVLQIGLGTFAPVRGETFRDHVMHEERYEVPPETVAAIAKTKAAGGRIVAVGTTVVRALESQVDAAGELQTGGGATKLFITPGYQFHVVDALVTNFHVPRSTLLALVCAFAGRERVLAAYEHAVRQRYRLFSFGDAMLIERACGSAPRAMAQTPSAPIS
jgi:S-adenosylmethionine:tRNA ribosyltransferase-isomerase